ncbi:OprO/OprP family phosphate-selective porin [Fulvimonas soli]|uniref:Phosphate-selective porin OprO/OprP n=1 Tax=Fulvimonas soli TaxID=155197 RepID=A0A316IIK1_9GAMM|nr:porin [Fulvimonas soli]PWK92730.1 phosphate-selective porin OprO/OprP [Fulvimonas soli]TNY25889.1 porin [Fulvimonas soli]
MTPNPRILPAAALGALLLAVAAPGHAADTVSNAELLKLVRQQAAEIKALKQRIGALEAHEAQAAAAPAAATPLQRQAAENREAVAAAVADARADEQALARARLVDSDGRGAGGGVTTRWGKGHEAGPTFSSDDGFFTFKPDGRLVMDFTGTRGSDYDARNLSGSQVNSVRLGAEGTMGKLGYHFEVDFAGNKTSLKEAYLSYATPVFGLPSKFYLGNFLKDLGTEGSSEGVTTPFMLRNAAATVGEPVNSYFGLGGEWKIFGPDWHYSLSVSGNSPAASTTGSETDSVAYLTRAHWNPLKGGDGFLHVGAWYYYEKIGNGVASINNTPAIALDYNGNLAVSASSIADPTQDRGVGYELGGVYRNFWAMGEYGKRTIDSSSVDAVTRHGSSLAAGWMITGEKPGFSSRGGNWQGVHVSDPLTSGGWGAFELAARVDHYDFTGAPRGGKGISYTLGLNWYFNDWSRLMVNYIRWYTDNKVGSYQGPDWGNSLGVRAQVVF